MIRITATLNKKLPISGIAYSSVEAGAQIEVSVTDKTASDALRARLRDLYQVLETSVEEQLARCALPTPPTSEPAASAATVTAGLTKTASGANGRCAPSTQAQRRAIVAICRSQAIDLPELLKELEIAHLDDLSVRQASMLIDDLKSRTGPAAS